MSAFDAVDDSPSQPHLEAAEVEKRHGAGITLG